MILRFLSAGLIALACIGSAQAQGYDRHGFQNNQSAAFISGKQIKSIHVHLRRDRAVHRGHRHNQKVARVERSGLVASINAKLRRWVKPSGKCHSGETETLTTYYNSGHRTANGERFHPMGLTAAHRSMAFGTVLKVRNPHTGSTATIRVNDRGPFTIASLDLAEGAARAIGMHTSLYLCVARA